MAVLAGCATQAFVATPVQDSAFVDRAVTQTDGPVRVTVAIPTAEETRALIGVDLYREGVQPVWVEAENRADTRVRVVLRSIDEQYFSPMEVAWKFRNRFGAAGRVDMERWFHEHGMPRRIEPGTTRSGFVFTHAVRGTKGFNVDVFSTERSYNFTFFVPIPGFQADYMDVSFVDLYDERDVAEYDLDGFRKALENFPCCSTDESGTGLGDPFNVVIVGSGMAVRRSLLRGNWQETARDDAETRLARLHRYLGRRPDGTFHKSRPDGSERKELRLWLAPMRVDGQLVWIGQVSYDMSGGIFIRTFRDYRIDPDIDDARMFLLQNFWYSQSLAKFGLAKGVPPSTIDNPVLNFAGSEYFTDGLRVAMFVEEKPVAMGEVEPLDWETLSDGLP